MRCKEIAKLLSEQRDHELTLAQRLMMKFHLSMCVFCRRLASQLKFMERLTEKMGSAADESPIVRRDIFGATLSQDAKTRMKNTLSGRNFQ